jgi:uncharacterized OsmC-like protein
MMGTFAAMLAKRRIPTPPERYQAEVRGDIEAVKGVLKITRIHVHYRLKLRPDQQEDARTCFETYLSHCPSAQSVIEAITLTHELELQDR